MDVNNNNDSASRLRPSDVDDIENDYASVHAIFSPSSMDNSLQIVVVEPQGKRLCKDNTEPKPNSARKRIWKGLPRALMELIFSYLTSCEIVLYVCSVCKAWSQLGRTSARWKSLRFSIDKDSASSDVAQEQLVQTKGLKIHDVKELADFIEQFFIAHHIPVPIRELVLPYQSKTVTVLQIKLLGKRAPQLESLEISSETSVSNALLKEIPKLFKRLRSFRLRGQTKVTDEGLIQLSEGPSFATTMEKLDVSNCSKLTTASIAVVAERWTNLRSLNFVGIGSSLNDNHFRKIAAHAKYLQELVTTLGSDVTAETIEAFASQCKEMEVVELRQCSIGVRSLEVLCSNMPRLRKLVIRSDESRSDSMDNLRIQSRSLREIEIKSAAKFNNVTFDCPNLEHLHLEQCREISGPKILCPNLKRLWIRNSFVNDLSIGESLSSSCPRIEEVDIFACPELTSFYLSSTSIKTATLLMCSDLTRLTLECNQLHSLKVDMCPKLRICKIECPVLKDVNLFTIQSSMVPELTDLQLTSNELESLSLQRCINIESLTLRCTSLVSLNISECKKITQLNLKCDKLKKVAMSGPHLDFSVESMIALGQVCPQVQMIYLNQAKNMDDASVDQMMKQWPGLQAVIVESIDGLRDPVIRGENLKGIQFRKCNNIKKPTIISSSLNKIFFRRCDQLTDEAIAILPKTCSNLKFLEVMECQSIVNPRVDDVLPQLLELHFFGCRNMITGMINSPKLLKLVIMQCNQLTTFGFNTGPGSSHLAEVILQGCALFTDKSIEKLQEKALHVQRWTINSCPNIVRPRFISQNLKHLLISDCSALVAPDASRSKVLEKVSIKNCKNFSFVPKPATATYTPSPALSSNIHNGSYVIFHPDAQIADAEFHSCPEIEHVVFGPDTYAPRKLDFQQCFNLSTFTAHKGESLEKLSFEACWKLRQIDIKNTSPKGCDIRIEKSVQLKSFKVASDNTLSVDISTCSAFDDSSLQNLIQHARGLKNLSLRLCSSLVRPIINSESLQSVKINNCDSLTGVQMECPRIQSLSFAYCKIFGKVTGAAMLSAKQLQQQQQQQQQLEPQSPGATQLVDMMMFSSNNNNNNVNNNALFESVTSSVVGGTSMMVVGTPSTPTSSSSSSTSKFFGPGLSSSINPNSPLDCLESLDLSETCVSAEEIEKFLERCPNLSKIELLAMTSLSKTQAKAIQKMVRERVHSQQQQKLQQQQQQQQQQQTQTLKQLPQESPPPLPQLQLPSTIGGSGGGGGVSHRDQQTQT